MDRTGCAPQGRWDGHNDAVSADDAPICGEPDFGTRLVDHPHGSVELHSIAEFCGQILDDQPGAALDAAL